MRTGPSERFSKALNMALGGNPIREITEKSLKKPAVEGDEAVLEKGGWGSGHFGHSGRPPKVGGSKVGGVKVGRGEMPDYASQFKFSGKDTIRSRPGSGGSRSAAKVQMHSGKVAGRLGIHGVAGKRGKTKKNLVSLGINGKTIRLGFKQLHDIRSKARWMHTVNTKNVRQTAGRDVARGESLEIQVGKESITIPINQETLDELHYATRGQLGKGESVSWPAEDSRQIAKIIDSMGNQRDPFKYLNDQKLSLGGRFAVLHHYVFVKMKRESLRRRMRANIKLHNDPDGLYSKAMNTTLAKFDKLKDVAEKKLKRYSGTQGMTDSLEQTAAAMFTLIRGIQKR
jgi:hypothetical protein